MNTTNTMQNMKGICYILIFFLCFPIIDLYAQGLQFYGYEKRIEERASYQVFKKDKLPDFSNEISVVFEYSAQDITSPGYILFLKDTESGKAYNLTYLYKNDTRMGTFMFSEDGKKVYYTANTKDNDIKSRWIPVSLRIYPKRNQADIRIGNDSVRLKDIGLLNESFSPQLYFGMCDYILEIASFSIRNLSVSNGKKKWDIPLNESHGEEVHDVAGDVIGHVKNPVWLINRSYYWEPGFEYYSASPVGFVFDKVRQKMFVYNKDSLITYDWYTKKITNKSFSLKKPTIGLRLGMNFLDETTGNVYAYELTEGKMISRLSTITEEWDEIEKDTNSPFLCLHHHCGFYNPIEKRFMIFGGYGNRKYSDIFYSYDISQNCWDTVHFEGDRISPRFFAGMAVSPDYKRMYIYGGKGNEAGDQNIGIEYYYDLYLVDLEKHVIRQLWEQKLPEMNRVVARDMVLSEDEKSIYFLAYPEYLPQSFLQLYRMDIGNGTYEILGDSIPVTSEEIATNANLYYDEELGVFYCTIQEFKKYGETITRVYSLMAPPVSLSEVKYYDLKGRGGFWELKYIAILFIVLGVGLFYIYVRRKKQLGCFNKIKSIYLRKEINTLEDISDIELADEGTLDLVEVHFKNQNAIYLFGTFTVLGRTGMDITYMFSPKLRIIFLYILLNSISGDGVLSSDMNELFWPDKTDDKAKNLKGVTVNHIRKLLQEMDGIELVYEKGHFRLDFQHNFYCDFVQFSFLLKDEKVIEARKKEIVDGILKILIRGKFLNGIDHELFDYHKHKIEELILALIPAEIDKAFKGAHFIAVIRMCNIWTAIDPLSEQALIYSICSYQKLNHPVEALKRYRLFATAYKKAMDEEYPIKYENLSFSVIK